MYTNKVNNLEKKFTTYLNKKWVKLINAVSPNLFFESRS
jgi:hypothetical protein